MAPRRKPQVELVERDTHPARPVAGTVDIKAMHDRVSKRYPKVLAELAR